jgi:hypothetical protein
VLLLVPALVALMLSMVVIGFEASHKCRRLRPALHTQFRQQA